MSLFSSILAFLSSLNFMVISVEHEDSFLARIRSHFTKKMKFENCRHILIEYVHYS